MSLQASLRGRRLEWLGTAVLIAAALWYWLQFFDRSTNLLDEGSTAAQAMRILNGELIYRDFFTVVTPGSYYTTAWLLRIFGLSLMVLRWAAVATGIGIVLVTLFVTRRIAPWPFAAGAALMTTVWGWFLGTPNFYSLEAALLALVALAASLRGWLFAAGVAAGAAALVKQNTGAYAAAALLMAIWLSALFDSKFDLAGRVRSTSRFLAGIAIVVLPTVLWLIASGAGPYLYESWVYYPLTKYPQRFAVPYPEFAPALRALPKILTGSLPEAERYDFWVNCVLHLPVVVYPLMLVALLHGWFQQRRNAAAAPDARALLAITLFGGLSLLQSWPRADTTHILFGLQPTFSLFAYLLHRLVPNSSAAADQGTPIGSNRPLRYLVGGAIALVPIAVLLWTGYQRTRWEYQNYVAGLHVERGRGIYTQYLEAQRIDTVTQYIVDHTTPDERIFVVPWASGFYFLTGRSNPTRTDFMLFEDPEAYPCLLARLDQDPPKYVIYGYTWDVDNKRFRDYAAPVDQYIRSRYAIEFTTDGYEIWRRLANQPAAAAFPAACQPRSFRWRDLVR